MIYVARHGQTQYNVDGKICGHADIELTEVGYAQAEELAQLVSDLEQPITKIYVSPLRRAQETARIINEKVSVPIETPEFQKVRVEFSLPLPDGESIMDVAGRVYPLLAELEQSDEDVLLVCHNALIRVIDNYFHGKTMIDFLKFNVDNTQLLRYERKRY